MNGVTGFNPSLAKSNIEDFNQQGYYRYLDLGEEYWALFNDLSTNWASPKAQEFDNTYRPKINELLDKFIALIGSTVESAVNAYNTVASAHGAGTVGGIEQSYVPTFGEFPKLLAEIDGVVGMEISHVRDNIMPLMKSKINHVVELMNEIPTAIALYDDENGQQHAYETHIKEIVSKIESTNNEVFSAIDSAITTEVDAIIKAKQAATDTLAG